MKNKIPEPVTFNPYKHHYYFINEQIRLLKKNQDNKISNNLLKTSNNVLDLYFGQLTVNQICTECLYALSIGNYLDKNSFLGWLKPTGFKKLGLSDGSQWLVRKGEDPERYIHIHPAKNSIYTTRVRGTTLKTVIALKIKRSKNRSDELPSLEEVNQTRVNVLKLSPIQKLQPGKGILKLWQLFNEK